MNIYEFCTEWVVAWLLANVTDSKGCVLDYGCGAGEIVTRLRMRSVEAFGCDVFYEGGDYSKNVDPGLLGSVIRRMDGEQHAIPFESATFDVVVNNQVMEHVEDLDAVLAEIVRVMKPGGVVLSLFPDKGVWREGHCGIAFLHWFPKHTRPRVYFAAAFRFVGFGANKGSKSAMRWSQDFCEWLDRWTYYRTRQEIELTYARSFAAISHVEELWLLQRLSGRKQKMVAAWVPTTMQRLIVRKLAGLAIVARKPA